ncbi:hypothetical protein [Defluviimonas sp. WL0075]|uniref:Uncharacterized protein n=1 Tax=Albidovulum sediminicola TaxID=2984331 RepID=A0ABT2Z4F5_9RHOB|nr:hypothetical protein [Defluviimonas sp. WL0075]MCV2866023.1 hypothetical protein [Defluviimonas sp. WL0075]
MTPLHKSFDTYEGWIGHYKRMRRWQERAVRYAKGPLNYANDEAVDFVLAYFLWAHSLREWLIETGSVKKVEIDQLLADRPEWSICRDLANRSRHYDLKKNPTDKHWILALRLDLNALMAGKQEHQFWYVLHDGQYREIPDCVNAVARMWEETLDRLGLERGLQ